MSEGVQGGSLPEMERVLREQAASSPAFESISAYISEHLADVSYMSAAEVAQASGVSQATVTRFCVAAGFEGFGDFVRLLQTLMREQLSAPERMRYVGPTVGRQTDRVVKSEIGNLLCVDAMAKEPRFHRLADRLALAEEVVLLGARASASLIPYAQYFLSKIRSGVRCATPGSALWEVLPAERGDRVLVLAFVFPRYPRVLVEEIALIHEAGIPVVAVADRENVPVAPFTDDVYVVPVTTVSLFDAYAGPMVFLNLLMREIARRMPSETEVRLASIEALDKERKTYFAQGRDSVKKGGPT